MMRIAVCAMCFNVSAGLSPPKRVHVVVNPKSGGGAGLKILEQVRPTFEAAGVEVLVLRTEYAGHGENHTLSADLRDGDALVGIGGDGTVHEIVNGMQGPGSQHVDFK